MSPETILADLGSGDSERIRAALLELQRRRQAGEEIEVPPLRLELLDAYGPTPPAEVQHLFLDVLTRYHKFAPPMSTEERVTAAVALVLRYGDFGCSYRLALWLKSARDPVAMVRLALHEVERQGLASQAAIKGAGYLVSNLLDGRPPVRAAVLDELRSWPRSDGFLQVINYVRPQLEPDEEDSLAD